MKVKVLVFLSIGSILGMFMVGAARPTQKNSNDALPFSYLSLEIESTKTEFLPLEPIPLHLKLENATQEPVRGHAALEFSLNHVELFVVDSEGPVKRIDLAKPITKMVAVVEKPFQPGEVHRSNDLLTVGTNDTLARPGQYQIQAVLHSANSYEQVKSNLLLVRVTEATGANQRALDLIRSESDLPDKFAGYNLSQNQRALAILESLSDEFSETPYGDYASFRVGEFYFYTEKYDKAKEYLDKLAAKPDFVFAKKASDLMNKLKGVSSEKVSQSP